MAKKNARASDLQLVPDESVLKSLDPKLQSLLLAVKSGERPDPTLVEAGDDGELRVEVLAVLKDPGASVPGLNVTRLIGDVATATVELSDIERVRQDPNVMSLKAARKVHADLHISVPEIHGSRQVLDAGLPNSTDGAGVVVGIVDFGCDFAHMDFLDANGKTRIKFLWDQSQGANSMSPAGFGFGREFSEANLNAALASGDPYMHLAYNPGAEAHGTHVMGIAAGNGRGSGAPGVAPGADIVFVQLAGGDTSVSESFGNSKRLLDAVAYIFEKADQLGKPAVINLSLGTHGGPHDGSTPVERGFDQLLNMPGRAIVISAGNSFERRSHASGTVTASQSRTLQWEKFSTDTTPNEIEVWYPGGSSMSVTLITPDGTRLGPVTPDNTSVLRSGGVEVGRIIHRTDDPLNHDNQIDIILDDGLPTGVWGIEMKAQSNVPFHAWIERDDDRRDPLNPFSILRNQSKLLTADNDTTHTLGSISCGARTIVVGSYDAAVLNRDLSSFTSSGPTRDGKQKPEISAPGHNVNAPNSMSRTGKVSMSGTSMAAPHITGVVALVLQVGGPLSIDEIRDAVMSTARTAPQQQGSWHPRYGVGRVDALAAVQSQTGVQPVASIVARDTAAPPVTVVPETRYHPILEHIVESLIRDSGSNRIKVRFELEIEPASRPQHPS